MGNAQVSGQSGGQVRVMRRLKEDTSFSRETLELLNQKFKHLCGHSKNMLSKRSFLETLDHVGFTGDRQVMLSLFNCFDKAGNGMIDFTELVTALSLFLTPERGSGGHDDVIDIIFSFYDTAGNDYITKNEMIRTLDVMQTFLQLPEFNANAPNQGGPQNSYAKICEFVEGVFQESDVAQNNRLSRQEFRHAMHRFPILKEGASTTLREVMRELFSATGGSQRTTPVASPVPSREPSPSRRR